MKVRSSVKKLCEFCRTVKRRGEFMCYVLPIPSINRDKAYQHLLMRVRCLLHPPKWLGSKSKSLQ